MTPSDFFLWAFSIALAWGVIVFFIPIDQWLSAYLQHRHTKLKELEARVTELERQIAAALVTGRAD